MARTPSTMLPLGTPAPTFHLPDTARLAPDGSAPLVHRDDFGAAPALLVAFLCNHCPFVIHIRPQLTALVHRWQQLGVAVVAISSNDPETYPQDGPAAMHALATAEALPYPYLFDATQEVALAFHAACTPDFFLFDGDRRLVYRGQLDPSRPGNDLPVTGADLDAAIQALLAGQPLPPVQHPSLGCNIKWREEHLTPQGIPAYC